MAAKKWTRHDNALVVKGAISRADMNAMGKEEGVEALCVERRLPNELWSQLDASYFAERPAVSLEIDYDEPDFAFLSELPHLRSLDVAGTRGFDLDVLRAVPKLRVLGIGSSPGPALDLGRLDFLKHLESLDLRGKITGFEGVGKLSKLRSLTARKGVRLDDLDPLRACKQLRSVELVFAAVADSSALGDLPKLAELEVLSNRSFDDASFLADCTRLETLHLESLPELTALPDLSRAKRLHRVHLHACKNIADLSPLATAPGLRALMIGGHVVADPADLRFLEGHPKLEHLDVSFRSKKQRDVFEALRADNGWTDTPAWG